MMPSEPKRISYHLLQQKVKKKKKNVTLSAFLLIFIKTNCTNCTHTFSSVCKKNSSSRESALITINNKQITVAEAVIVLVVSHGGRHQPVPLSRQEEQKHSWFNSRGSSDIIRRTVHYSSDLNQLHQSQQQQQENRLVGTRICRTSSSNNWATSSSRHCSSSRSSSHCQ